MAKPCGNLEFVPRIAPHRRRRRGDLLSILGGRKSTCGVTMPLRGNVVMRGGFERELRIVPATVLLGSRHYDIVFERYRRAGRFQNSKVNLGE